MGVPAVLRLANEVSFCFSIGDLVCFQRDANEDVPGCTGGRNDRSRSDFCVKPEDLDEDDNEIKIVDTEQNALLGRCEGDCDVDEDCEGDMVCFQRDDCMYVPGCTGGYDDYSFTDYCVRKSDVSAGKLPLQESYYFPLALCQGDCDYNWDCEPGLICQQRDANEEVIGCIGGGSDSSRTDYCVSPNNRGNTRKAAIESSLGHGLIPYNEEALEWLINKDHWVPPIDEEKPQELWRERYAMAALYFSTDGDKWLDPGNYLSPESVCAWSGFGHDIEIWCDANNRVLGVTGRDNGMLGSIPSAMEALTMLQRIDFHTNNIRGSIPSQLGVLDHLTRLDFYDNDLTGSIPKELGNLLRLEEFRLFENALTGSLPAELGNCSNLKELTVSNNSIFGSIPTQIGALTKLFSLDLSNNRLTGSLPNSISNLTRLANFFGSHNRLTGSIPASAIRRMTSLEIINLRENRIEGSLPTELGRLSNIYTIDLAYNDMTGSIPSEIAMLPRLHGLGLRGNKLSGPLPTELVDMDSLTDIDFRANELTGDVPRLPTYLTNCKLDGNRFSDTSNADGICRT
ncbi:MAG: hypothetical protein SGBAC_007877 [Bacillariaceae sp.]